MEHSRVKKFKEYRDSFTKVNAQDIGEANDIISGLSTHTMSSTTNTLPYDQVLTKVDNEDAKDKEIKRRKIKKYCKIGIFCLIGAIIIAGIVVLGIIAFGG